MRIIAVLATLAAKPNGESRPPPNICRWLVPSGVAWGAVVLQAVGRRYRFVQSRRCRELGIPIFWRYFVMVRRATWRPCLASSSTNWSSL